MKVIYIRDSKSRGYLKIGISDGDKKYEYTLSEAEYRECGSLLSGDEIFDTDTLKRCDMRYRAKLYALRILAFGDNNVQTLIRKLISRSISSDIAKEVATEMVGRGYIDEHRQLERLIEREVNTNLSGKEKLILKLASKGYHREEIESVLEEFVLSGAVDFEASKKKLISKKLGEGASAEDVRRLLCKYGYRIND